MMLHEIRNYKNDIDSQSMSFMEKCLKLRIFYAKITFKNENTWRSTCNKMPTQLFLLSSNVIPKNKSTSNPYTSLSNTHVGPNTLQHTWRKKECRPILLRFFLDLFIFFYGEWIQGIMNGFAILKMVNTKILSMNLIISDDLNSNLIEFTFLWRHRWSHPYFLAKSSIVLAPMRCPFCLVAFCHPSRKIRCNQTRAKKTNCRKFCFNLHSM